MDGPALDKLIRQGDPAGVEAAQAGLTEAARKALAAPVTQLHRQLPDWRMRNVGPPEGGPLYWEVASAVTVAGAAVLPPAQLASFLARAEYYDGSSGSVGTVTRVVRVLLGRDLPTLPGIVERVAARIGGQWDARFSLVDDLVQALDCDPPGADRYLLAWLEARRERVPADLRRRPAWAALIPRLFEVRGGGTLLDDEQRRGAFRQAVEDGVLDRATMLDAALSALQRGGRPGDQRGYLAWHETLDPSADEVAARSRQYVSLLAAAGLSTAAGMAQSRLRALDEAGRLDLDTALAAARGALARGEKGLVKAALTWLEQLARREPTRLGEVLTTAAAGFDQPVADLQARTLRLIGRFAATLPPEQRAELAGRAAGLPPDLRARARSLLGGPVPQDEPAAVVSQQAPATADRPTEPAVASPAELAELAAHFYGRNFDEPLDPTLPERILDGLVRLSWSDRNGVRTALGSALSRQGWLTPGPADLLVEPDQHGHLPRNDIETAFGATLRVALGPPPEPSGQAAESVTQRLRQRPPDDLDRLNRLLRFRFAEVAVALSYRPVPFLLSTPTSAAGSLDPGELLRRLDGYARTGVRPLPHDLAQALLRLPADGPARLRAALGGLDEPLRSGLRSWLEAQPLSLGRQRWTPLEVRRQPRSRPLSLRHERLQGADLVAVSGPAATEPMPAVWEQAWTVPVSAGNPWFVSRWIRVWPGMLPHRRDVVAAHLLLSLLNRTAGGRGGAVVLTDLAAAAGPVDDALRLALAYGLGAHDAADRSGAVDAVLALITRHELDTTALGDELGSLVVRGVLPLNRLVATSGDICRAGDGPQGWRLLAAMLARCLVEPEPPAGLADLLALAVQTAQAVQPGGPPDPDTVPGLDAVADRPGSSRARTEARRLRSALRQGPPRSR